jgi:hypothetical protein
MGVDEQEKNLLGQVNKKKTRKQFSPGFMCTLPMLVNFQSEIYNDGIVRLQLIRAIYPLQKLRAGFYGKHPQKAYG